ncbi:MAG: glutamate--cysteine ligase [Gammaproteobacteria bacterium]|nr:glutamate--cysteine ligase [Gammaproteobacteria bacterium]
MNVPHLTTATTGPLLALERQFLQQQVKIETWLREKWQNLAAPFYCSVDLRNAGFKVAPVDTNLFPAGFNNLNSDFMPLCIQAVQATMAELYPGIKQILLVPENHTRNQFYLENLAALQEILVKAGFATRVGSLLPDLTAPSELALPSGRQLLLEPLVREGDRVSVADFSPCLLLLNNDLSGGIPEILTNLQQAIVPAPHLGWFKRLKSEHFSHYQTVSTEFAEALGLDPWLINPIFRNCGEMDFLKQHGLEGLQDKVTDLLASIRGKYREYKIEQKPFVMVKADAGTYGMAVMMVQDAKELAELNRKQRTHMAASKNSQSVNKVIIQEGVYTFETWGEAEAAAEPVVYMLGKHVVGGFYRVHSRRGINENLNAPGMQFEPLAFAESCNNPDYGKCDCCANRFYIYGVVARLALLAAAYEFKTLGESNP